METNYFLNPKEEFKSLYFDKLLINGIAHCMKINPKFKIPIEPEIGKIVDNREKNMESCLEKYFALHKLYDEELVKHFSSK